MMGRTHVLIAGASWLALYARPASDVLAAPVLNVADSATLNVPLTLAVVAFGALLPDLDHPHATISELRVLGIRAFAPIAYLAHAEFRHRGPLHSLLAAAGAFLLGVLLGGSLGVPQLGGALAWGYAAHIAADFFTEQGVPLLWPLSRAKLSAPGPLAVRTGGFGEMLYLLLVGVLGTAYATGYLAHT